MKHIITSVLYLIILLCLSVFVFDRTNLYYELTWLDIPMHVMGGFGVASFVMALGAYKHRTVSLIRLLTVYACVAVGWELYEVVGDSINQSSFNGWSDTISDFINGALGAVGAYYLLKK